MRTSIASLRFACCFDLRMQSGRQRQTTYVCLLCGSGV